MIWWRRAWQKIQRSASGPRRRWRRNSSPMRGTSQWRLRRQQQRQRFATVQRGCYGRRKYLSRKLYWLARAETLFVAECVYGIEFGGFHGGPNAEDEADADTDGDAGGSGPERHDAGPLQSDADQQH